VPVDCVRVFVPTTLCKSPKSAQSFHAAPRPVAWSAASFRPTQYQLPLIMLLNLLVILNLALLSTASVGQGEILPFQNATTVLFVDSLYNTVELFPDRSHVKTRDVVSLALLPTAASSLDSGASRYNLDVANPLTPIVPCSDGVYCCPSSDDCYPDLGMCCIKGGVTCGY